MRSALFAAALISVPAAAQDSAPADAPFEVVVVGNRHCEQQIPDFVDALSDASPNSAIARFDGSSVCPTAVGLSDAQNGAIAARMRNVAFGAGEMIAAA